MKVAGVSYDIWYEKKAQIPPSNHESLQKDSHIIYNPNWPYLKWVKKKMEKSNNSNNNNNGILKINLEI